MASYAVKRAKFNVFMLVLELILTTVILLYTIKLVLSPAQRKSTDPYTFIMLALFQIIDIVSIWNASALI